MKWGSQSTWRSIGTRSQTNHTGPCLKETNKPITNLLSATHTNAFKDKLGTLSERKGLRVGGENGVLRIEGYLTDTLITETCFSNTADEEKKPRKMAPDFDTESQCFILHNLSLTFNLCLCFWSGHMINGWSYLFVEQGISVNTCITEAGIWTTCTSSVSAAFI